MSSPVESLGVESDLMSVLMNDTGGFAVRAKFTLKAPRPAESLMPGDSLDVIVTARVFDQVGQAGLPPVPYAQGSEIKRTARVNEWSVVDLDLPPVPWRTEGYFVQAKVYPRDERYRRNFEPSDCYVRTLKFGFPPG